MGRERQKKKNRSGLSRVRQKTKSKKTVLSNPIIAANWDKTQTLSQNYRRLGLARRLNKQTGGIEKKRSDVEAARNQTDSLQISSTGRADAFGLEEEKVERDEQTGRIVRVIQSHVKPNPLGDALNEVDSDDDVFHLANQHGNTEIVRSQATSTDVIRQLEERANMPAAKYKRRQTDNEIAFIETLVRKYGEDYAKMARDTKINYMQRTEGDLKKRIKTWKENGGVIT